MTLTERRQTKRLELSPLDDHTTPTHSGRRYLATREFCRGLRVALLGMVLGFTVSLSCQIVFLRCSLDVSSSPDAVPLPKMTSRPAVTSKNPTSQAGQSKTRSVAHSPSDRNVVVDSQKHPVESASFTESQSLREKLANLPPLLRKSVTSRRQVTSATPVTSQRRQDVEAIPSARRLLLVAVMTMWSHVGTRVLAIQRTWGQRVTKGEVEVIFFVGARSSRDGPVPPNLKIVQLADVSDDEYPPRRKSFAMLTFIARHLGDRFWWVLRADDDVYVRTDALLKVVASVPATLPLYLGQPGRGSKQHGEEGRLGLKSGLPYCMGGPGVLLSAHALESLEPHLSGCLGHAVTRHEDSELGRCLQLKLGLSCRPLLPLWDSFLHHYTDDSGAWVRNLSPTKQMALTFHPLKEEVNTYFLYNFFQMKLLNQLRRRFASLKRSVDTFSEYIEETQKPPARKSGNRTQEVLPLIPEHAQWKAGDHPHGELTSDKERSVVLIEGYDDDTLTVRLPHSAMHDSAHGQDSHAQFRALMHINARLIDARVGRSFGESDNGTDVKRGGEISWREKPTLKNERPELKFPSSVRELLSNSTRKPSTLDLRGGYSSYYKISPSESWDVILGGVVHSCQKQRPLQLSIKLRGVALSLSRVWAHLKEHVRRHDPTASLTFTPVTYRRGTLTSGVEHVIVARDLRRRRLALFRSWERFEALIIRETPSGLPRSDIFSNKLPLGS